VAHCVRRSCRCLAAGGLRGVRQLVLLLLPRWVLRVVAAERIALRGGNVVHGGWYDALDGGLREQIRVKTCSWMLDGAGDGGATGTISFLKASLR
jgi:hypothetical protein